MPAEDDLFRWFALAVLALSLGISAFRRRQARQQSGTIARASEPAALVAARLLVALPLFGGVFAYVVNPAWMAWASLDVPLWVRWVGVLLGAETVFGVYWTLTALGKNVSETVLTKTTHQLVTHGPYRWIRHPLYTVGVMLFTSIGLMAANAFILSSAVVVLVAVRLVIIPREEANLVAAFGDAYRDYQRGTGAMWPSMSAQD